MTEEEWLASKDPVAMLARITKPGDSAWPQPLRISDRKLRLFACACCRQVWDRFIDERSRNAVEVAEKYADNQATLQELMWVYGDALDAIELLPIDESNRIAYEFRHCANELALYAAEYLTKPPQTIPLATQAALLRDITGNPFRPVTFDRPLITFTNPLQRARFVGEGNNKRVQVLPLWLTPVVIALAEAAYQEQTQDGTLDPARLAILADALEEAGCMEETLLRHLRGWDRELLSPNASEPQELPLWLRLKEIWKKSDCSHIRGCWALDLILGKE